MNKLQRALGIGVLVSSLTSGCYIDSGQVVGKRYEPQREYVEKGAIASGKRMIPVQRTMIDDEDYIIIFGRNEENKFRSRAVYVSKGVYDSLKVGDSFDTSRFSYEKFDSDYAK